MNKTRFVLGLSLTAVAGAVDAVSFARLGAVYASFMSGNTVQVGLHTAQTDWLALAYFVALVASFAFGGCIGSLLTSTLGRWHLPVVLLLEGAAISLALYLDLQHQVPLLSTAPLAFAMGAQNNLVVLVRGANPATTFVTGTAFRFGDSVAQRLLRRDPHGAWRFHLAVWLSFAIGAALGGLAQLRLHDLALLPIAGLLGAFTLVAAVVYAVRKPEPAAA